MNNNCNHVVAYDVAAQLFAAEDAIDEALKQTADLMSIMPSARRQMHTSAGLGQEAIERALEALSMLGEARRRLVATHTALAKTQRRIGLDTVNFGAFIDKPRANPAIAANPQPVATAFIGQRYK